MLKRRTLVLAIALAAMCIACNEARPCGRQTEQKDNVNVSHSSFRILKHKHGGGSLRHTTCQNRWLPNSELQQPVYTSAAAPQCGRTISDCGGTCGRNNNDACSNSQCDTTPHRIPVNCPDQSGINNTVPFPACQLRVQWSETSNSGRVRHRGRCRCR